MFIYKSRFMTRGEVWFDDQPDDNRVDWIYYMQRSSPTKHCKWKYFFTRLVDLRKSLSDLFEGIDEKTTRKIAEARDKDKIECVPCDSRDPRIMAQVEGMWNDFAAAQKTPLLDRAWLNPIIQNGRLDLTAAKDPAGNILAYNLVFVTQNRARELIAVSPHKAVPTVAWRNLISRANCLIHWNKFQAYREEGLHYYDFGGWYPGATDMRLLGMNAFKKSFGGKVVREYECEQPVSVKGWVLLSIARILCRAAQPHPLNPQSSNHETHPEEHKISPAFR